jgi:hypothetical protein
MNKILIVINFAMLLAFVVVAWVDFFDRKLLMDDIGVSYADIDRDFFPDENGRIYWCNGNKWVITGFGEDRQASCTTEGDNDGP